MSTAKMSTEPQYVFTRDYLDNSRINIQHYQWVELFGYHLHPQIPLSGAKLPIADIATGTGSKQAVPEDLVEKYDIVHVRLLILVLRDDEGPGRIAECNKVVSKQLPTKPYPQQTPSRLSSGQTDEILQYNRAGLVILP
ncbi:hypothetical protein CHU98_g11043 [Xylaria longipes]|nr:hypothetical protein CHU98_g11043 [Xylaria longipes]